MPLPRGIEMAATPHPEESTIPATPARPSGLGKVWLLTAVLASIVVGSIVAMGDWPAFLGDDPIPWWALMLGFYLAEIMVVHIRFRRDAHSFSMSEIPLVIGLFFVPPAGVVAAGLIANTAVLAVHRRQPAVKLAFNVAQFGIQSIVAIVVFRALAASNTSLDPAVWMAALAAAIASLVIAAPLINLAMRFMGATIRFRDMVGVLGVEAIATSVNVALALVAVVLLETARQVAVLGFVAPVTLYLAYRAYVGQRQERSRLTALYDATKALHRSPQIETALLAAARHAQRMLDGETGEIVLFPVGPDETAYRTWVGPGRPDVVMEAVDLTGWDGLWQRAAASREGAVLVFDDPLIVGPDDARWEVTDAVVAPVLSGSDVVGMLVVANHLSDVASFEPQDVDAITTLAGHVGVSLENGRLEDSLEAVTELKEELRHQALHDPVTGLANRVLFMERLEQALARAQRHASPIGVLYLDLDDFKSVNDRFGHAAGDRLLRDTAERMRQMSRTEDTVARLSGDEFAVIVEDGVAERELIAIAERMIVGLGEPFDIESTAMRISVSVGIAVAGPGEQAEHLLRRADAAMYRAKRSGKGRLAVAAAGVESSGNGGASAA